MIQSQISRRLQSAAALAQITAILSREHFASRRALGRRICDARGLDGNCRVQLGNQSPQTRNHGIAVREGCRQGRDPVGQCLKIVNHS